MNSLKQRFSDGLHENEVDVAALALLAIELLAVSANPGDANKAQAASARAVQRLVQLKAGARNALAESPPTQGRAETAAAGLVDYLGHAAKFSGNSDNYYSVDNSNLGWVLAERLGIPITLAIIYIDVGRSLGYDVRGIGFPGHFLVGVYAKTEQKLATQLIDPFSAKLVNRQDCMRTLARKQGNADLSAQAIVPVSVDEALFVASTPRQILLRLLENLKQIHLHAGATGPSLTALELQIVLAPDSFDLRASIRCACESDVCSEAGPKQGSRAALGARIAAALLAAGV